MKKVHKVDSLTVDELYLYLSVDGQPFRVRWSDCSTKLSNATTDEREYIEISPSGYGLHWPLVDEDLAIDPLLQHAESLAVGMTN